MSKWRRLLRRPSAAYAVDKDTAGKIFAALQTLGEAPSFETFWPLVRRA
jgi:hypothetical protein